MINVRGFPEINGENFPLDIWSLYMQEAVKEMPVQELDTPSSDLKLQVKTDGRATSKPAETTGKTKGSTTRGSKTKESKSSRSSTPNSGQQQPAFQPPPPSNQPQQPPDDPRPPPIYGRPSQ
jgi:penicillin-binding protein 1A